MNNTRLLTVIILLQVLTIANQWFTGPAAPSLVSPAQAQVPDAGAQRLQIIDELKGVNDKLGKMVGMMESGNLQVRVVTPDDNKAGKAK